jgi:hypothetical protein
MSINPESPLSKVKRGKQQRPPRILLYGVEKIGKSSFAADAPNPIFICPEDGISQIDVPHFPEAKNWDDVMNCVRALYKEQHDYNYLVLDTLDWLEPLLWDYICTRDGEKNIESYGYGKGYVAALDEWRAFISALEYLRNEKNMGIIMLAHSTVKNFKDPEGEGYDRYEMKIHQKSGGLIKEWSDAVLFTNYEIVTTEDKRKRVRGISTGARMIYTNRSAAYDAGNRYGLPAELPLDWQELEDGIKGNNQVGPDLLLQRIEEILKEIGDDKLTAKVNKAIKDDPIVDNYNRILNKLIGMQSSKENRS